MKLVRLNGMDVNIEVVCAKLVDSDLMCALLSSRIKAAEEHISRLPALSAEGHPASRNTTVVQIIFCNCVIRAHAEPLSCAHE